MLYLVRISPCSSGVDSDIARLQRSSTRRHVAIIIPPVSGSTHHIS